MPELSATTKMHYYAYTITFKPMYKVETKFRYIRKLRTDILNLLTQETHGVFKHVVEYHKHKFGPFQGTDKVTAPHVHGIVECADELSQRLITKINRSFVVYGRSEFIPLEDDYSIGHWKDYIEKDVDRLNIKYPSYKHSIDVYFEWNSPVVDTLLGWDDNYDEY